MLLLDATHTSHTRAQTGIQRVVRSLFAALQAVEPLCFDPYADFWRPLAKSELACLCDRTGAGASRGAKWSWTQRTAGRLTRLTARRPAPPAGDALVCPELFSPKVAARLPDLFAAVRGPRVAIFYDAIALKFPELTPPATVARMPGYLRELLAFDGIAAISEDSAASLRDFWQWLGAPQPPPVQAIPLGLDVSLTAPGPVPATVAPRILCVSTIEGRKNHLALLDAAEALWQEELHFELQLIGLARPDTAGAPLARIHKLQSAGRPLLYKGMVPDEVLEDAYRRCAFTVYPSLIEGFGLPVLESLQHGRPCICSGSGALGESARGGGCLALDRLDAEKIAAAMRQLLTDSSALTRLAAAAHARKIRTWSDYAGDLSAWMSTLPRRG